MRKIQPYQGIIEEIIPEARNTVTITVRVEGPKPEYKAGQFITLEPKQFSALRSLIAFFEKSKGKKELVRAYSLSSAPHESHLAFTVKEEPYHSENHPYPPLLSPLLVHLSRVGLPLTFNGFSGPYVLPEDIEERTDTIVHLVAGSGATPNFSILKDSLLRHSKLKHHFIYSNKNVEDICFLNGLERLRNEFPQRLILTHTLTQQSEFLNENYRRGRIDRDLLETLIERTSEPWYYVCGPAITTFERRAALQSGTAAQPRFLESTVALLKAIGVPDSQIKRESWG